MDQLCSNCVHEKVVDETGTVECELPWVSVVDELCEQYEEKEEK